MCSSVNIYAYFGVCIQSPCVLRKVGDEDDLR
jgi:hypothetical protein